MEQVVQVMQPDAGVTAMETLDEPEVLLPEHELQLVFECLSTKDLKVARQVCKKWAITGGDVLAKRTRVFMKTDDCYRRVGFEAFLEAASDPEKRKFMRFRDIELYHVYPGDRTIALMLKSPCVKDSLTSLRIHGPQLKWIKPVLPELATLKILGFDDTWHFSSHDDEMELDDDLGLTVPEDVGGPAPEVSQATCDVETLEVHINGSVRRNPLNWLLPMAPALKNMKLVVCNTNQLRHCAEVFQDQYIGPGLKGLRISGSFGYTWNDDTGEKIPDREGARVLSAFLTSPGTQGLKNLAIHAPCYPSEWRDRILNDNMVNSLVSLQMDVYLRVAPEDFANPNSLRLELKPTPRNPEPQDFLSAFPKDKDGVIMPNLRTLKIDVDIRGGSEVQVSPESFVVLKTTRILPSLVELEIDVRMLRFVPVDITRSFSHAFPALSILSIGMSTSSFIRPMLLNLPRGLKFLKIRSTTAAGKCDNIPRLYEILYHANLHRLTDAELLDGEILSNFPELTELLIDFNCTSLTDRTALEGFAKMPRLEKVSLGGPPEFSEQALKALTDKGITFTSAWREEY